MALSAAKIMFKVPQLLLSLLFTHCTSTSRTPTPSSTPAAAYLISPEGIGEARLGMKLGELKQKLADGAELGEDQPFLVDLNAIPVRINKEVQYYILHFSSEPLTDSDPIPFLMTDNPKYRTAEGVGPGVAIAQAKKVYSDATLYYNLEIRIGVTWSMAH
jgi:hypothetical protein